MKKKIQYLLLMLCVIMSLCYTPLSVYADDIDIDSEEIDIFQSMTLGYGEHTYKFKIAEDCVIDAVLTSDHAVTYNIKEKVNGVYVNVIGNLYKKDGQVEHSYFSLKASDEYYYLVFTGHSWDGEFSFKADKMDSVPNAATKAASVDLKQLTAGQIYTKVDVDWYKFKTGKGDILFINATAGSWVSPLYEIYSDTSEDDKAITASWKYNSLNSQNLVSNAIRLKPNTTYYMKVSIWNGNPGEYSFTLSSITDVPNVEKSAKTVKLGKKYESALYENSDIDFYKFKATKTKTVKFTLTTSDSYGIKAEVYRKGSAKKTVIFSGNTGKIKVTKGKWYIVKIYGNSKEYSFTVK